MNATISAKEVNELRKLTGAGIMDCKKALTEANGDIQAAIDYLRKKGQKVAELRAGREANEGVIMAITNDAKTEGVVLQLTAETDFVAKNEDFINFARVIAELGLRNKSNSVDELMQLDMDGASIDARIKEKVAAIGENIAVVAYNRMEGNITSYIHMGFRIGVLVNLSEAGYEEIGKDVAMQIAAMNPVAVDESGVSQDIINREMEIGKEQAIAEGKPEAMVEKIAQGKVNKFLKENTLVNQVFVKDSSKTVAQVLKEKNPNLKVKAFSRLQLGS